MCININTNILCIINYDIVNQTTHIEKISDSSKVLKKEGKKLLENNFKLCCFIYLRRLKPFVIARIKFVT